ncbi:hypothetical protein SRABI106_01695 [Rahnella aquatilis]|nr:hypothetical protein SRABI106_01695 [Rahnella aquatilis]
MRCVLLCGINLWRVRRNLLKLWRWHTGIVIDGGRSNIFYVVIRQHGRFLRIPINNRNITGTAGDFRFGFKLNLAGFIHDFGDEIRVNQITAVGQCGVTAHHL